MRSTLAITLAVGLLTLSVVLALPTTPIQQAAPNTKPTTNYVVINITNTYNVTNMVVITNWPALLVIQDLYLPTNTLSVLSK